MDDRTDELMDVLMRWRMSSRGRLNANAQLAALDDFINPFFALGEFDREDKEKILALRDQTKAKLDQPENIKQSIENALRKVFASEFDESLLHHGATEGRIRLVENDLTLIDVAIIGRRVRLNADVEPLALKDATFIDSPLILNYHDMLLRSKTLLDMRQRRGSRMGDAFTTLHTKDLFDKLRRPAPPFDLFDETEAIRITAELEALMDGGVEYDRKERDFIFRRQSGDSISIKNAASGVKVFGLLKMLVANEFVTKDTILIFDEPENHLHPKWQLKLAQMLVKLAESGVYILVSSHSPYMIEALKRHADRADLAKEARFALAQDGTIKDEDRLSAIFSVLAEPFEEFRKMDAEDLRDE